jgi:hypothetical protein
MMSASELHAASVSGAGGSRYHRDCLLSNQAAPQALLGRRSDRSFLTVSWKYRTSIAPAHDYSLFGFNFYTILCF